MSCNANERWCKPGDDFTAFSRLLWMPLWTFLAERLVRKEDSNKRTKHLN